MRAPPIPSSPHGSIRSVDAHDGAQAARIGCMLAYSWLNAIESFVAGLSKRWFRRGVFGSIADLSAASTNSLHKAMHHYKEPHIGDSASSGEPAGALCIK